MNKLRIIEFLKYFSSLVIILLGLSCVSANVNKHFYGLQSLGGKIVKIEEDTSGGVSVSSQGKVSSDTKSMV